VTGVVLAGRVGIARPLGVNFWPDVPGEGMEDDATGSSGRCDMASLTIGSISAGVAGGRCS
jgi:hypothetical protein